MSTTHYWERPTELPAKAFAAAVRDCARYLPTLKIDLAGHGGQGQPVFQPDHIVFNGRDPNACEPLEIRQTEFDRRGRAQVLGFCKTMDLPYDLAVMSALIIFAVHLQDAFKVTSDAPATTWHDAAAAILKALGIGDGFALDAD